MASIVVEQHINASVERVWESWNQFGDIAKFHPGIKSSRTINSSATEGVGAERQCDLSSNGKQYVRERVVKSVPNQQMVVEIYAATVPIKRAEASLHFKSLGPNATLLQMRMEFTPAMGVLGWFMTPMMKLQFRGMVRKLLAGNDAFVTQGLTVAR
jgi:ribosome-associated toxin RatA of RatAB toxin-antitoxin module